MKLIFLDDYTLLKNKKPDRFFILLILLHTGARIGEVAQLKSSDVKKDNGVWCFNIHPSVETSVKTKSNVMLVTMGSYLIKGSFIKYFEDIRRERHTQLFPNLKKSANGYGSAISKWFNKRLREKGIADRKKVLHSTPPHIYYQVKTARYTRSLNIRACRENS